jgi:hypothetical protein
LIDQILIANADADNDEDKNVDDSDLHQEKEYKTKTQLQFTSLVIISSNFTKKLPVKKTQKKMITQNKHSYV